MTFEAQRATFPQPSPKIRRGGQKSPAPVQVSAVATRNYSRFEVSCYRFQLQRAAVAEPNRPQNTLWDVAGGDYERRCRLAFAPFDASYLTCQPMPSDGGLGQLG